ARPGTGAFVRSAWGGGRPSPQACRRTDRPSDGRVARAGATRRFGRAFVWAGPPATLTADVLRPRFSGLCGPDHPPRVRPLHRREGGGDAGRAVLALLRAAFVQGP